MNNKLRKKRYKNIEPNDKEKRLITTKDAKRARKIKMFVNLALVFVLPFFISFFAILIQKESMDSAVGFIQTHFSFFMLNYLFVLFIYFLFQMISAKPALSFVLTNITYLSMPIISRLKFDVRGEVLLINDLSLINQTKELTEFVELSPYLIRVLLMILFIIIAITVYIKLKVKTANRMTSFVAFGLLLTFFGLTFVIPRTSTYLLKMCGIDANVRFSPNIIHERQGTWLGLYTNYIMNKIEEPVGYSKEKIFAILENADRIANEKTKQSGDKNIKPNVIMIMSESFYDPENIPNVKFSQDPIPNVRKYMEDYESGTFISSTFAGGTSTIEFEAFTGETVEFMPYGTVPYTDIPKQLSQVASLQKEFKNSGYKTIAIHSYDGDFYNRNEVYPYLGFDDFFESKEMDNVAYYGKFISDYTMMECIKDKLNEAMEKDEPIFIWGLTMQNHVPYQTSNFTEGFDKVKIESGNLSETAKDKLLAYINGVYESDLQLKNLIDYLELLDEPTVLMFFGDHLPSLYEVYYETKMISTKVTSDWSKEEMFKMHQTPYFIYDNYSNKKKEQGKITGAVLMGNELLNYIGLEKSSYYNFLDTLNYRALRDRLFVDNNGKIYDSISEECYKKAEEHKMLEYDMTYGMNYAKYFEYTKNN